MTALADDLAQLDGEQLYNLIIELDKGITEAHWAVALAKEPSDQASRANELLMELLGVKLDALAQIARIAVPVSEAVKIIYRARFARTHPVRVPGT